MATGSPQHRQQAVGPIAMDVDPPEDTSYTHECRPEPNAQVRGLGVTQPLNRGHTHTGGATDLNTFPRTLHAPTPHRRIGGGLAVQPHAYGTPSPTPSPSPRASPGGGWRESADALQADIAEQFEAEDRRTTAVSKRKRKEDEGIQDEDENGDEDEGMDTDQERNKLLDDLASWLVETKKRRK